MRKSAEAKVSRYRFSWKFDIQVAPILVNLPSRCIGIESTVDCAVLHSLADWISFELFRHATCCESHLAYWLSFRHCSSCLHCSEAPADERAQKRNSDRRRTSHGDKLNIYKISKHSPCDVCEAIMDCCGSAVVVWVVGASKKKNLRTRISIGRN